MKTIELNIGLNNNPLDVDDILNQTGICLDLDITDVAVLDSQYKGQPEETLVILAKLPTITRLEEHISRLCDSLTQESIAYTLDGRGELVYRLGFEGDRQEFNYNFFQTLQTFGKGTRTGGLLNTGHGHPSGVIKRR
jgi:hypothetical protein